MQYTLPYRELKKQKLTPPEALTKGGDVVVNIRFTLIKHEG